MSQAHAATELPQKLTIKDLCALYKIGRTTFWRLTKQEGFPSPVRFGRAVRWSVAEVEAFLKAQGTC